MEVDGSNYVTLSNTGDDAHVKLEVANESIDEGATFVAIGSPWGCGGSGSDTYLKICAASGAEHDGTPSNGARLSGNDPSDPVFEVASTSADDVRLERLGLEHRSSVCDGVQYRNGTGGRVVGCILYVNGSGYYTYGFYVGSARGADDDPVEVEGCIAIQDRDKSPASGRGFRHQNADSSEFRHCVAAGKWDEGFTYAGTPDSGSRVDNCVAYDCNTSYSSHANIAGTNNAASDASTTTPPYTAPITTDIVSGDFLDESSDDFHCAASGSTLQEAGATGYGLYYDIDGDTWTNEAVGADDGPAGGGGATAHPRHKRHGGVPGMSTTPGVW
jgi:hypothetical protein